ncbi:MAG: hypothetical protein HYW25_03445 [Candidatus Aenigmarchaeota archaeon]|nr:hypothetical protein [Candidatus Aenigmarchaeota archaeon]
MERMHVDPREIERRLEGMKVYSFAFLGAGIAGDSGPMEEYRRKVSEECAHIRYLLDSLDNSGFPNKDSLKSFRKVLSSVEEQLDSYRELIAAR